MSTPASLRENNASSAGSGRQSPEKHEVPERFKGVQTFSGEYDAEGVYFYQAFKHTIADYAVKHQRFGGPEYLPGRMTWIKPSFAWMLYRCGYGQKPRQERVLKLKLSHDTVAEILSGCVLAHTTIKPEDVAEGAFHGSRPGRIQWDPARDLMSSEGKNPTKMFRERAIQIGMKGHLARLFVGSVLSIEDITDLAHKVREAHAAKGQGAVTCAMEALVSELPVERDYMPACTEEDLRRLGMLPGPEADTTGAVEPRTVQ